ncbi:MAG: hypothetical protein LBT09_01255 [Planctomycetaceae bacterium]|jgi:hypothetical protein|nr:hypothetical protein [Planctomycetaceae bacterium]
MCYRSCYDNMPPLCGMLILSSKTNRAAFRRNAARDFNGYDKNSFETFPPFTLL